MAVTFAATLIDQWRSRGVRHVIVSPGSRSTPLVIGLQWVLDHQGADAGDLLRAHVVLDERSAAFQAGGGAGPPPRAGQCALRSSSTTCPRTPSPASVPWPPVTKKNHIPSGALPNPALTMT